jgi:hypothetical protein
MKPILVSIALVSLVLGFALGRISAPTDSGRGESETPGSTRGKPDGSETADGDTPSGEVHPGHGKRPGRTRAARDRAEDSKPKEPRVSIPLAAVVRILKEQELKYADFKGLDRPMEKALTLLGATETEREAVNALVTSAETEMFAEEKKHLRLGEVSGDQIQLDMRGMKGPAEAIAARMKEGIRAALPADMAEALISAINWQEYYPVDDKSFARLEVTRGRGGRLTAWERTEHHGTGRGLDAEFGDDGTPLPADRIFEDRWKPFLKGVTILPKDEE